MQLFRQHFRSELGGLLSWGGGLAGFSVLVGSAFAMVTASLAGQLEAIIAQMPPQMIEFLGGSIAMATVPGIINAAIFSGFVPLLVTVWTALAAVAIVTADWDRGTLEFLLALPVHRWRLLAERWMAFLLQLTLLYAVVWTGTLMGLALIGESVSAGRLAAGLALGALAQAALGGMVLLLTLGFRDQTRGVLVAVTGALVLHFLPVFVESGSSLAFLRQLSPLTHAAAPGLLTGAAFPWSQALLLLVWAATGAAVSIYTFTRQEV